jgi:prefoldin subunit 5
MIRKLGLQGFETTAEAINLLADKIDELVGEVNRVNQRIDNIAKEIRGEGHE